MTFDQILRHVDKHISLSLTEQQQFTDLLQHKTVARGEMLLSAGQPCQYLDFVNSGILRAYHLCGQGKETTLMFAMSDWWITDMASFVNTQPALISVQAVKQAEVLRLSKANMDTLLAQVPQFERCFRILFQNAYIREQLRSIETLTQTAGQRYTHFIEKYPRLCESITQKQIASYLGITPEFLSAIKNSGQ